MTHDHAEFIAARVPGAGIINLRGGIDGWSVSATAEVQVGVYLSPHCDIEVVRRLSDMKCGSLKVAMQSAIAASVAAGFPDPRKD